MLTNIFLNGELHNLAVYLQSCESMALYQIGWQSFEFVEAAVENGESIESTKAVLVELSKFVVADQQTRQFSTSTEDFSRQRRNSVVAEIKAVETVVIGDGDELVQ